MEILTGVDRRRRWSVEDKLKIVREAFSPGSSIATVARRHDVCRSQIYQWRRAFRLAWLRADEKVIGFHPVEICDDPPIVADAVEPSRDIQVTISLRADRVLSFSSGLSCGEIKRLKTYLGRVFRDVCRKIEGHLDLAARFARLQGLIERLLAQKPDDNNKLYALHAPEVVCISKGKAHKRYEFGCKVGLAATNREGLFIAGMAFEGNPYDGHTLKATAAKTEEMTGVAIQRLYADKGYRGHDYDGKAKVMLSGNKRGLTPTMKRELKRRSAIVPMIGHAKNDGRLGRNYLLGVAGDKINAILAAAGHNLRLVLRRLALLLTRIPRAVAQILAAIAAICAATMAISA